MYFFKNEEALAVMPAKVTNKVPRAAILEQPRTVNMDISFEDGCGTSSRAKAEGLDHRERAGLKRITGSVQKKDIHIPWNRGKARPL